MTESIELIIKDNLEKYADYDVDSSRWNIYYDDLYELIDKVLVEFYERYLKGKK